MYKVLRLASLAIRNSRSTRSSQVIVVAFDPLRTWSAVSRLP